MNLQKLSLTQRQPEIIQPNSLQALPAQPGECVIPGGKHRVSKGQSIKHHRSPPPLPATYWVRLHIDSVSSSPLRVESLNSALIAGTSRRVLCKSITVPCRGLSDTSEI